MFFDNLKEKLPHKEDSSTQAPKRTGGQGTAQQSQAQGQGGAVQQGQSSGGQVQNQGRGAQQKASGTVAGKKGKKKGGGGQSPSQKALKSGSVSLPDLIAPSAVEVDFKHVRVGDKYYRTFFVVDYPRQVSPNWLSTIIDYKETMNIAMYTFPVESKDVLSNLKRKIGELEANIESDYKQGLDPDPKMQAALEDAISLREELARGLERFFQFGLYVTLSADSPKELDEKCKQFTNTVTANLLVLKPATLQMEEGFKTTMPQGHDRLFVTRNMDTSSVAMTFPFTSYEISQEDGLLYGINTINNSLVVVDRFSFENANEVVFGKSGSGKSFQVKLEILRQMMFETEILVIDPEDEYRDLCHSLGGEYITFSKNSEVKLNPFALNPDDTSEGQLGIKILSLHGLLKAMLGETSPTQDAMLDRAIVQTYKQKSITPDPSTYKNEPPILEDLYKTLLNMEEQEAKDLAFRLEKYVKGGFAGLFNNQTNYDVRNQLTVFSIKQLEDALRPIAMHVILDFIWGRVRTKLKKRILVVDEAWYMMRHPDSASFLQGLAKRARKYYLGVTTLTQDIEDFLNNEYGRAIVSNSSIQILLKQGSAEVEALAKAFNLSEGEKQFLLTAQVGEGLLFAGQNHITAQFIASQFEYNIITSKPQDILERQGASPAPQAPPEEPSGGSGQTTTPQEETDAAEGEEGEKLQDINKMFADTPTVAASGQQSQQQNQGQVENSGQNPPAQQGQNEGQAPSSVQKRQAVSSGQGGGQAQEGGQQAVQTSQQQEVPSQKSVQVDAKPQQNAEQAQQSQVQNKQNAQPSQQSPASQGEVTNGNGALGPSVDELYSGQQKPQQSNTQKQNQSPSQPRG